MNVGQRDVSYQSASASVSRPSARIWTCARPISAELRTDRLDRGGEPVEKVTDLPAQAPALDLAGLGEPVEAPRPALGVLPLPGHEALGLQAPQQWVHRVGVDGDQPPGQPRDALHELVAVARAAGAEVQDEQAQQPGAAQLADERVRGARAARL